MLSFRDKYGVLQCYVYWLKMSQTWNSEELVKSALSHLHASRSRWYLLLSSSSVCDFLRRGRGFRRGCWWWPWPPRCARSSDRTSLPRAPTILSPQVHITVSFNMTLRIRHVLHIHFNINHSPNQNILMSSLGVMKRNSFE